MKAIFSKKTLLIAVMIATISTDVFAKHAVQLVKQQSHNIYQVVKNKTLLETTNQIANITGITFKISASVENDAINQKLAADDWKAALTQLLQGYNYTLMMDQGVIKTVLISSRNGSVQNVNDTADDMVIAVSDFSGKFQNKFNSLKPGMVMAVGLLPDQDTHERDNLVDNGDDTTAWIGYLDDEGGYYH